MKNQRINNILLCLIGSVVAGCAMPDSPLYDYSLTYIESVTIRDAIQYPEPWYIEIHGRLPEGARELNHVEMRQEGFQLLITPVARQHLSGRSEKETLPYKKSLYYTPTSSGEWHVFVIGINDTLNYEISVY
ncbi:MAG TPA: hypothetical protein ENN03_03760 [bacterium]|nr:hypothetical protein [bacterium]